MSSEERLAAVAALLPSGCWVTRSDAATCADLVGGQIGNGPAVFEWDMACLPCRIRHALIAPIAPIYPDGTATREHIEDRLDVADPHLPGCERFPTGWLCVAGCSTVWHDTRLDVAAIQAAGCRETADELWRAFLRLPATPSPLGDYLQRRVAEFRDRADRLTEGDPPT